MCDDVIKVSPLPGGDEIVNAGDDPARRTHDPASCAGCRGTGTRGGEHAMATPKQGQGHKQPSVAKPVKKGVGHEPRPVPGTYPLRKNPGHEHEDR